MSLLERGSQQEEEEEAPSRRGNGGRSTHGTWTNGQNGPTSQRQRPRKCASTDTGSKGTGNGVQVPRVTVRGSCSGVGEWEGKKGGLDGEVDLWGEDVPVKSPRLVPGRFICQPSITQPPNTTTPQQRKPQNNPSIAPFCGDGNGICCLSGEQRCSSRAANQAMQPRLHAFTGFQVSQIPPGRAIGHQSFTVTTIYCRLSRLKERVV